MNVPSLLYQSLFKAISHKDFRADAQSAFSADCSKRCRNTGVFQGVLGKDEGKDASVCAAKRVARSLCGVALKSRNVRSLKSDCHRNANPTVFS